MPGVELFLLLHVRCFFLPVASLRDVRYVGRFTKFSGRTPVASRNRLLRVLAPFVAT
jgi:hypothetical protein